MRSKRNRKAMRIKRRKMNRKALRQPREKSLKTHPPPLIPLESCGTGISCVTRKLARKLWIRKAVTRSGFGGRTGSGVRLISFSKNRPTVSSVQSELRMKPKKMIRERFLILQKNEKSLKVSEKSTKKSPRSESRISGSSTTGHRDETGLREKADPRDKAGPRGQTAPRDQVGNREIPNAGKKTEKSERSEGSHKESSRRDRPSRSSSQIETNGDSLTRKVGDKSPSEHNYSNKILSNRDLSPMSKPSKRDRSPKSGSSKRNRSPKNGSSKRNRSPTSGSSKRNRSPKSGSSKRNRSPKSGSSKRNRSPKSGSSKRNRSPTSGSSKTSKSNRKNRKSSSKTKPHDSRSQSPQRWVSTVSSSESEIEDSKEVSQSGESPIIIEASSGPAMHSSSLSKIFEDKPDEVPADLTPPVPPQPAGPPPLTAEQIRVLLQSWAAICFEVARNAEEKPKVLAYIKERFTANSKEIQNCEIRDVSTWPLPYWLVYREAPGRDIRNISELVKPEELKSWPLLVEPVAPVEQAKPAIAAVSEPNSPEKSPQKSDQIIMYVKYLPKSLSNETAADMFRKHGKILRFFRPQTEGQLSKYAFVTFARKEDGVRAIRAIDGHSVGQNRLRVWKVREMRKASKRTYSLSLEGIPPSLTHHDLESVFDQFGIVDDLNIDYAENGDSKCRAFVLMRTRDMDTRACMTLNKATHPILGPVRVQILTRKFDEDLEQKVQESAKPSPSDVSKPPGGQNVMPPGGQIPPGGHNVMPHGGKIPPGGQNVMPPGGQIPPGGHNVMPHGGKIPPGGQNVMPPRRRPDSTWRPECDA
eukprot:168485_1